MGPANLNPAIVFKVDTEELNQAIQLYVDLAQELGYFPALDGEEVKKFPLIEDYACMIPNVIPHLIDSDRLCLFKKLRRTFFEKIEQLPENSDLGELKKELTTELNRCLVSLPNPDNVDKFETYEVFASDRRSSLQVINTNKDREKVIKHFRDFLNTTITKYEKEQTTHRKQIVSIEPNRGLEIEGVDVSGSGASENEQIFRDKLEQKNTDPLLIDYSLEFFNQEHLLRGLFTPWETLINAGAARMTTGRAKARDTGTNIQKISPESLLVSGRDIVPATGVETYHQFKIKRKPSEEHRLSIPKEGKYKEVEIEVIDAYVEINDPITRSKYVAHRANQTSERIRANKELTSNDKLILAHTINQYKKNSGELDLSKLDQANEGSLFLTMWNNPADAKAILSEQNDSFARHFFTRSPDQVIHDLKLIKSRHNFSPLTEEIDKYLVILEILKEVRDGAYKKTTKEIVRQLYAKLNHHRVFACLFTLTQEEIPERPPIDEIERKARLETKVRNEMNAEFIGHLIQSSEVKDNLPPTLLTHFVTNFQTTTLLQPSWWQRVKWFFKGVQPPYLKLTSSHLKEIAESDPSIWSTVFTKIKSGIRNPFKFYPPYRAKFEPNDLKDLLYPKKAGSMEVIKSSKDAEKMIEVRKAARSAVYDDETLLVKADLVGQKEIDLLEENPAKTFTKFTLKEQAAINALSSDDFYKFFLNKFKQMKQTELIPAIYRFWIPREPIFEGFEGRVGEIRNALLEVAMGSEQKDLVLQTFLIDPLNQGDEAEINSPNLNQIRSALITQLKPASIIETLPRCRRISSNLLTDYWQVMKKNPVQFVQLLNAFKNRRFIATWQTWLANNPEERNFLINFLISNKQLFLEPDNLFSLVNQTPEWIGLQSFLLASADNHQKKLLLLIYPSLISVYVKSISSEDKESVAAFKQLILEMTLEERTLMCVQYPTLVKKIEEIWTDPDSILNEVQINAYYLMDNNQFQILNNQRKTSPSIDEFIKARNMARLELKKGFGGDQGILSKGVASKTLRESLIKKIQDKNFDLKTLEEFFTSSAVINKVLDAEIDGYSLSSIFSAMEANLSTHKICESFINLVLQKAILNPPLWRQIGKAEVISFMCKKAKPELLAIFLSENENLLKDQLIYWLEGLNRITNKSIFKRLLTKVINEREFGTWFFSQLANKKVKGSLLDTEELRILLENETSGYLIEDFLKCMLVEENQSLKNVLKNSPKARETFLRKIVNNADAIELILNGKPKESVLPMLIEGEPNLLLEPYLCKLIERARPEALVAISQAISSLPAAKKQEIAGVLITQAGQRKYLLSKLVSCNVLYSQCLMHGKYEPSLNTFILRSLDFPILPMSLLEKLESDETYLKPFQNEDKNQIVQLFLNLLNHLKLDEKGRLKQELAGEELKKSKLLINILENLCVEMRETVPSLLGDELLNPHIRQQFFIKLIGTGHWNHPLSQAVAKILPTSEAFKEKYKNNLPKLFNRLDADELIDLYFGDPDNQYFKDLFESSVPDKEIFLKASIPQLKRLLDKSPLFAKKFTAYLKSTEKDKALNHSLEEKILRDVSEATELAIITSRDLFTILFKQYAEKDDFDDFFTAISESEPLWKAAKLAFQRNIGLLIRGASSFEELRKTPQLSRYLELMIQRGTSEDLVALLEAGEANFTKILQSMLCPTGGVKNYLDNKGKALSTALYNHFQGRGGQLLIEALLKVLPISDLIKIIGNNIEQNKVIDEAFIQYLESKEGKGLNAIFQTEDLLFSYFQKSQYRKRVYFLVNSKFGVDSKIARRIDQDFADHPDNAAAMLLNEVTPSELAEIIYLETKTKKSQGFTPFTTAINQGKGLIFQKFLESLPYNQGWKFERSFENNLCDVESARQYLALFEAEAPLRFKEGKVLATEEHQKAYFYALCIDRLAKESNLPKNGKVSSTREIYAKFKALVEKMILGDNLWTGIIPLQHAYHYFQVLSTYFYSPSNVKKGGGVKYRIQQDHALCQAIIDSVEITEGGKVAFPFSKETVPTPYVHMALYARSLNPKQGKEMTVGLALAYLRSVVCEEKESGFVFRDESNEVQSHLAIGEKRIDKDYLDALQMSLEFLTDSIIKNSIQLSKEDKIQFVKVALSPASPQEVKARIYDNKGLFETALSGIKIPSTGAEVWVARKEEEKQSSPVAAARKPVRKRTSSDPGASADEGQTPTGSSAEPPPYSSSPEFK